MTKRKSHGYKKDIAKMAAEGKLPTSGVYIMHIQHDNNCSIWKAGGVCDCKPDYSYEIPAKDAWPKKLHKLMDDNSKIGGRK